MRRMAEKTRLSAHQVTGSSAEAVGVSSRSSTHRAGGVPGPGKILRRHSTLRRSTRSINRTGYAFSHQEGFGRLITTGTNMFASLASTARIAKQRTPFAHHSRVGRISGCLDSEGGVVNATGAGIGGAGGVDAVDGDTGSILDGRYRLKPMSPVAAGFTTPFDTRLTVPAHSAAARRHDLQLSPAKRDSSTATSATTSQVKGHPKVEGDRSPLQITRRSHSPTLVPRSTAAKETSSRATSANSEQLDIGNSEQLERGNSEQLDMSNSEEIQRRNSEQL